MIVGVWIVFVILMWTVLNAVSLWRMRPVSKESF